MYFVLLGFRTRLDSFAQHYGLSTILCTEAMQDVSSPVFTQVVDCPLKVWLWETKSIHFLKDRPIFYSVEYLREVGEDELTAFARVFREEGVAVQLYRSPVKVLLASLVVLNWPRGIFFFRFKVCYCREHIGNRRSSLRRDLDESAISLALLGIFNFLKTVIPLN